MTDEQLRERFEIALNDPSPVHSLALLARALKVEGMSQRDMYNLFDTYRTRHHNDADETKYNAILDTMDVISGWCNPSVGLFDPPSPN